MPFERVVALSLLALLAACQGEKAPEAAKKAGGEILKGSVSDAMLPLDQLRSQPPLAPKSETGGEAKPGAKPKPKAPGRSEAAAPEAAPAPEPEPAPEPAKEE